MGGSHQEVWYLLPLMLFLKTSLSNLFCSKPLKKWMFKNWNYATSLWRLTQASYFAFNRTLTVSLWPWKAAWCSEVQPHVLASFTSQPIPRRRETREDWKDKKSFSSWRKMRAALGIFTALIKISCVVLIIQWRFGYILALMIEQGFVTDTSCTAIYIRNQYLLVVWVVNELQENYPLTKYYLTMTSAVRT